MSSKHPNTREYAGVLRPHMTAKFAPIDGLRGLHQDLVSLVENQLHHIDALRDELEAHVESFRKLLDKPPKNDVHRKTLQSQGQSKRWCRLPD